MEDQVMLKISRSIERTILQKIFTFICVFFVSVFTFIFGYHDNNNLSNHQFSLEKTYSNKVLMVKEKPFFPLGLYYIDFDLPGSKINSQKIAAINQIFQAGFNTVHLSITPYDQNIEAYRNVLKETEKLGIYVINENPVNLDRKTLIKSLKSQSSLLGWNIGDDVNLYFKPKQLLNVHRQVKEINPHLFTYISMFDSRKEVIKPYLNTSDLVGMQSYPISNRPINSTYTEIKNVVDLSKRENGGAVIANLQAFQWYEPDKFGKAQRLPTFQEVKNMTYQALLAGAKGIIYYAYRDDVWSLPDHPELWRGVKSLVPEIKTLIPILLNGKAQEINTGLAHILAGTWVCKDQTIAMVINTSETQQTKVEIKMPDGVIPGEPMFEKQPSNILFVNGKLSGNIKPLAVHLYKFGSLVNP
jgi:hypothetical protein